MAEHLTAGELRERLDLERTEFDRLQRARKWPRVRTKEGDRFPWPQALHAYVAERERVARAELPADLSGEQFADLVKRSTRSLHNYQKEGLPYEIKGKSPRYPLPAALHWCIEYFVREHGGESENKKEPSLAAQIEQEKLLKARNDRVQSDIDLAERHGQIVTIGFMRREFEETMAAVRDVLLNLPGDLSDRVLGLTSKARARAIIRADVDKAMAALRDALTRVAEREGSALAGEDEPGDEAQCVDETDEPPSEASAPTPPSAKKTPAKRKATKRKPKTPPPAPSPAPAAA